MKYFLGIDIGGSWIKAISIKHTGSFDPTKIAQTCVSAKIYRIPSGLSIDTSWQEFTHTLDALINSMGIDPQYIAGIGVSTAGIVNYHGAKLTLCAPHLVALKSVEWIDYLRNKTKAPVMLINDADAATIGASALGYLRGNRCYGVMPIGTGLGFTVIRNSRRWTPNFSLTLLGSLYTPVGGYDAIASASLLEKQTDKQQLNLIFTDPKYTDVKEIYLQNLAGIIASAHVVYGTDEILLGGGFADAAVQYGYGQDIEESLEKILQEHGALTSKNTKVTILREGNLLPLIGAVLLSLGESQAQLLRKAPTYTDIKTESAYDSTLHLDKMDTSSILDLLSRVEQESCLELNKTIPQLTKVVDLVTERLKQGGRLIYVGCGTSGRLAAVDTVEIACTFGFPRDKVLALISGGVADAAIDIESRFEEDASSVPELLMASVTSKDVIVGISVSGTAYYVQSALGLGKSLGALSVLIQEKDVKTLPFCDYILPLHSGAEVIAGSTRMKAGTATKKITNFLSTAVMIKLGKVHGTYMTELECINEKLIKRAISILESLLKMDKMEALALLKKHKFHLNDVLKDY